MRSLYEEKMREVENLIIYSKSLDDFFMLLSNTCHYISERFKGKEKKSWQKAGHAVYEAKNIFRKYFNK